MPPARRILRALPLAAGLALLAGCQPREKPATAAPSPPPATSAPTATPASAAPRRSAELPPATAPSTLEVAPGFKVELLYTVPPDEQGSWVAMTLDPKGRIIASDQYGALYRVTLPPVGTDQGTRVERLDLDLRRFPPSPAPVDGAATDQPQAVRIQVGAQGLLHAFDSLYIMVNEDRPHSGLWRVRDTDGDDQYDEAVLLRAMKGTGEHGPHALVLGPDGQSIYFANGNHTELPAGYERARMVAWGEDHLLPRMWDARGHAREKYAPGGYIGRTDPDGRTVEIFAIGFRNQYDLAFDQNGELFTFDSDMEWDQGTPWYVPTRINHVVDGGDFGWRSGAGRWPAYYADSLPEVINIGPGSPTGIAFGTGARFPARYQRALFAADWTFGTLYAIHFRPDGSTFAAENEEFVAGKPLPLTDLLVNPGDGALYFIVGGRRTQAALYRVSYVGDESTAPAAPETPNSAALLRRSLEALHADGLDAKALDTAWPHLDSPDRFIRFAARVVLEKQPVGRWADRALAELRPRASLEALIALARVGDSSLQPRLFAALERHDLATIPSEHHLPLLRAWQLVFTRLGKPDAAAVARVTAQLDPHFPHKDPLVSRELVSLLIYLGSPTVVAKTVPLLEVAEPATVAWEELGGTRLTARNDYYGQTVQEVAASRPDRQQIAYVYALRNATAGWTPALRDQYFDWFSRTTSWRGGASFGGFLENIRAEAIARVVTDPVERVRREAAVAGPVPAAAIQPTGPGRAYSVADALAVVDGSLRGRDFNRGRDMFAATACAACHRFGSEGSGIGPDLTAVGSRYNVRDLLENIIDPSRVISDQYGSEEITRTNGSVVIGRVAAETDDALSVIINPFLPDQQLRLPRSAVKSRRPSGVSQMPPGLVNALNEDELRDLVAYLLSGGNRDDPMFKP